MIPCDAGVPFEIMMILATNIYLLPRDPLYKNYFKIWSTKSYVEVIQNVHYIVHLCGILTSQLPNQYSEQLMNSKPVPVILGKAETLGCGFEW